MTESVSSLSCLESALRLNLELGLGKSLPQISANTFSTGWIIARLLMPRKGETELQF